MKNKRPTVIKTGDVLIDKILVLGSSRWPSTQDQFDKWANSIIRSTKQYRLYVLNSSDFNTYERIKTDKIYCNCCDTEIKKDTLALISNNGNYYHPECVILVS